MQHSLRWLLVVLNTGLIICAVGTDVTLDGSWPVRALAAILTVAAMLMLPHFWIKTRTEDPR